MKRGRGPPSASPAYGVSSTSFDADTSYNPLADSLPVDVAAQETTTAVDTREDAADNAFLDVSLSFRTGSSLSVNLDDSDAAAAMVEGGDAGHSRGMVEDNLVPARSIDDLGTAAPPGSDDDDDAASLGPEPSIMSDTSSIASALDDLGGVDVSLELGFLGSMDLDAVKTYEVLAAPEVEEMHVDLLGIGVKCDDLKGSICVEQMEVQVREAMAVGLTSVFLKECVPLWGSVSICGRRPEMEDAVVAVPHFFEIPLRMLIGDCAVDGLNPGKFCAPSHFFGVYDGHGGAQVANYCQERMHLALIDKLRILKEGLEGIISTDCQKQWERAFNECFLKVDDEVGGKVSREDLGSSSEAISVESRLSCSANLDPVAPETVGSTAVVSIICSSHIIVANCGDSRAVLCRGKQAMPLSVDHKPNREDEYARIEAAGGKVIQWNGYRVFGVLAMSRSIGDRYLKPWIIPEPEVRIISRTKEDECLILASDGLWDVMSNEEVCDAARRRLLLWHKKNSSVASDPAQRGLGADAASQAAAEYLSKLALQRGSKDNITVIVIDLKTQRKFKMKT